MTIKYVNEDHLAIVISRYKSAKKSLELKALNLFFSDFKSARTFILSYLPATATCLKLLSTLALKRNKVAVKIKTEECTNK